MLAEVWRELLQVRRVGRDDRFFDLGGHSLLALRLLARVRDVAGVELKVEDVFAAPTLGEMAAQVDAARLSGDAGEPPRRLDRTRPLPLSAAQGRLWLLDRLHPGNTAYNMTGAVRLRGALDVAALGAALGDVLRRHEVLRSRFPANDDGEPVALVEPAQAAARGALPRIDLAALPPARRETELRVLLARQERRPFDLAAGPLIRFALFGLAAGDHAVLATVHHIVFDGASMPVLLADWGAAYAARSRGEASPLAEPPFAYADLAAWRRRRLEGGERQRLLAFWTAHLGSRPTAVELPTDQPRRRRASFAGEVLPFTLPEELATELETLARGEGASLFMVLLAAFQVALAQWSGQRELVVGVPVAGRTLAQEQGLVGFFVNLLPLTASLADEPSFRRHLARVRRSALDAFAHQDLPFDELVSELALPRPADGSDPLIRVLLNYNPQPPETPRFRSLRVEPMERAAESAVFDLTLLVERGDDGLAGRARYRTDLFDRATVETWIGDLEEVLRRVAADPEATPRDFAAALQEARRRRGRRSGLKQGGLDRLRERRRAAVAVAGDE